MKIIRHKDRELEWHGWPNLYKANSLFPLKLCYNGTAGWWIERKVFLSYNQVKKLIKT